MYKRQNLPNISTIYTTWEEFRDEHGWDITGDEGLIKSNWDKLERQAFSWIYNR